MPHIKTNDGVRLYYEETGTGTPLLLLHEFGGHYMSWEPQVRYFSRRYRCITYAARGWPPSDVPDMVSAYSQARAADDAADVMKALGIERAHLCGLSMGATAGLEFAVRHPGKALSLTIAAGGGGGSSDPAAKAKFKEECDAFAQRIEREGMPAMAELYCASSARVTYKFKDPRGWAEFKQQFADGSATGHAMTMRGVQGARQPFFERTAELAKIAEPMLVIIGDEDEFDAWPCGASKEERAALRRAGAAQDRPHHEPRGAGRVQRGRAGLPARCRERQMAGARQVGRLHARFRRANPRSERSQGATL